MLPFLVRTSPGVTLQATVLAVAITACGLANAQDVYLREQGTQLEFGNGFVELKIDPKTGFFRDIYSKVTGIHHKASEGSGSWPYGMRLGHPRWPDLVRVEITSKPLHPQQMSYQVVSDGQSKTLTMTYDDLVTTGGSLSGVQMTVSVSLADDADYFLIRAHLKNGGKYEVTNFYSGGSDLIADENREKEVLAVPDWGYGTEWTNPHSFFTERETFGYPQFGSNAGLDAGWMDLYGEKGGIGIGYLNRQGLTMFFNVEAAAGGMKLNWQLFNLLHEKASKRWTSVGGIYGLEPGKEFTSDPWILALHAGDWHRMADIYRSEYERVFEGDYLTWEETSEVAKKVDFAAFQTVRNIRDQFEREPRFGTFDEVAPKMRKLCEDIGVAPENVVLNLWGHSRHFCLYMPDFYPAEPAAGGNGACKKMTADLRAMGMEAILFYSHLFYNHPKAHDYVAEAETGYDHQNLIWKEIGHVANMTHPKWVSLWRDKYIPGYQELGAAGVTIDQGPTQYLVPPIPGADNLTMLGAHVKGVLSLVQEFRHGYTDSQPVFWTEVGSDLPTRFVDIWSAGPTYSVGGTPRREIVRYTFPYRLATGIAPKSAEETNKTLVNGLIMGSWGDTLEELPAEMKPVVRQFLTLRKAMREKQVPGFPHGFRDTVGLTIRDPAVVARTYRDDQGITVVYYANDDTESTITVDKEALGFPGRRDQDIRVTLAKNEASYAVITP